MKVYLSRYIADMTEGRGPMVNDRCFLRKPDALTYINSKEGVMGRKPPLTGWQSSLGSDWDVKELYVIENLSELNKAIQ